VSVVRVSHRRSRRQRHRRAARDIERVGSDVIERRRVVLRRDVDDRRRGDSVVLGAVVHGPGDDAAGICAEIIRIVAGRLVLHRLEHRLILRVGGRAAQRQGVAGKAAGNPKAETKVSTSPAKKPDEIVTVALSMVLASSVTDSVESTKIAGPLRLPFR